MVEQSGTALLLEQICNHHEDKIMPLGAFKAALMGTAGVSATGDVVLLSSQTASNSATISFTSGITSTYGEYIFRFYNINPATDGTDFTFQVNATDDPGGDYDVSAITSASFYAEHREDDGGSPTVTYAATHDLAEAASFQILQWEIGNAADEGGAGELHLFNPASTTYVKHFYSRFSQSSVYDSAMDNFAAGYINDTTAVDDIQFKMAAGNFDGTIKMWGVK